MGTTTDAEVTQKNEFRFVGMSRSGNHAIINWVINQLNGKYCFLNCAEPKHNPFATARPLVQGGKTYETNQEAFDLEAEVQGEFSKKDYLLYSHEDCFLGPLNSAAFRKNREEWLGTAAERKDILILRDPFNLFASRIKSNLLWGHYSHGARPISTLTLKRIYKQHARTFLGEKKYLRNHVFINYTTWTISREYRQEIAEQLDIPFSDEGFEEVSGVAGGSSFDGMKHSGRASKMQLHDRWKEFASDENFWELFDPELAELTQKIFGDIPPVKYYFEHYCPTEQKI